MRHSTSLEHLITSSDRTDLRGRERQERVEDGKIRRGREEGWLGVLGAARSCASVQCLLWAFDLSNLVGRRDNQGES